MSHRERKVILSLMLLVAACLSAQERQVDNMNFDWQFSRDSLFRDSKRIDVPHDFQIEQPWVAPAANEQADNSDAAANVKSRLSARGFKEMGTGWYRKTFVAANEWKDRRVLLDFEGIMLVGDVFLNGERIGGTDYGYVGFEIDITDQLKYGQENILVVKASTMGEKNSRWYTGGGLFRPVSIVVTPKDLYFNRHPLHITTRDNRYVNITAELTNRTKSRTASIGLKIFDPQGQLVYQGEHRCKRISPARTMEARLTEVEIPKPLLWDTEHPNLYTAVVTLTREDGSIADEVSEQFGIRTIEIGPAFGLKLNGKKVLLKGYANHHTLGALGAAAYPRAIEKRIQLMKQFGVNHIRTSHNPYSRQFIKLCDQYGILVVDELYDKWTQQYAGGRVPFMNHWAQDVTEWVKRDRNSPSVVLWSLGNELQQIADLPFGDFGVTCYKMMKTVLQRYDSTRMTTVAMHPRYRNWETDSLPCDLAMKTDVQSYNYRYMYFPGDGKRFPWMTFYQSEASTGNMGPNFFEMDLDKVIGLAYWGAIDYLGESQGWPAKGWAQGVFDITLQPKPKAYLMKSMFSEEPTVHIAIIENAHADMMWNGVQTGNQQLTERLRTGTPLTLYTYTNAEEVELFVDGRSVGTKRNPADAKQRNQLLWKDIACQKGKIEAIARNNGKIVARHQLETTGQAVRLVAETDNTHWKADGMDLQHVSITAVDEKGRRVWDADDELTFEVEGPARLVAVANGDITSNESYQATSRHLWHGHAVAILRATQEAGTVVLKVKSKHYKQLTIELKTQNSKL